MWGCAFLFQVKSVKNLKILVKINLQTNARKINALEGAICNAFRLVYLICGLNT